MSADGQKEEAEVYVKQNVSIVAAELAKLMSDLEEINMKAVGAEVAHQESVLKTAQGSAIAADVIFFVIGAITIIMVIKSVAAPIHAIIKI